MTDPDLVRQAIADRRSADGRGAGDRGADPQQGSPAEARHDVSSLALAGLVDVLTRGSAHVRTRETHSHIMEELFPAAPDTVNGECDMLADGSGMPPALEAMTRCWLTDGRCCAAAVLAL